MQRAQWLEKFVQVYSTLGTDNLTTLESIYHPDVTFVDPLHKVEGYSALLDSFQQSYSNILQCDFYIEHLLESGNEASVYWTMEFRHKKLNGGEPVSVEGHSHLKAQDDLVIYHRDYLDVGAMIYEHVPLLGFMVKAVKRKAAN